MAGDLGYLEAAVLGALQGATEFLPVSSSGHLAIAEHLFAFNPDSPPMLLFNVLAHFGTLIAVVYVFRRSILLYARRLLRESKPGWKRDRVAWRMAGLGIAATIPTVAIGLGFKDQFESAFANTTLIGSCLLVTGLLLAMTGFMPRGRLGWRRFSLWRAVVVGLAQGAAILPGISRSGATICTASILGLRRRWAGEFSFFIAAPAITGATVLKLKDTLELPVEELSTLPWKPVVLGSLISLVVGIFALIWLLNLVRRAKLHYFAAYCWIVGVLVLTGVL